MSNSIAHSDYVNPWNVWEMGVEEIRSETVYPIYSFSNCCYQSAVGG